MKNILKIFLLIICLGLLISCANNTDLSTIFNHDKTTSNDTSIDEIKTYRHNINLYQHRISGPKEINYFVYLNFDVISNEKNDIKNYSDLINLCTINEFNLNTTDSIFIDNINNENYSIDNILYDNDNLVFYYNSNNSKSIHDKNACNLGDDYYLSITDNVYDCSNDELIENEALKFDNENLYKHNLLINYYSIDDSNRIYCRFAFNVSTNSNEEINSFDDLLSTFKQVNMNIGVTGNVYVYDINNDQLNSYNPRTIGISNDHSFLSYMCFDNNFENTYIDVLTPSNYENNSCCVLSIIDTVSLAD